MPSDGERGHYSITAQQVEHKVTAGEKMGEAGRVWALKSMAVRYHFHGDIVLIAAMPPIHQSANNQWASASIQGKCWLEIVFLSLPAFDGNNLHSFCDPVDLIIKTEYSKRGREDGWPEKTFDWLFLMKRRGKK